jgi:hypothetical protein
MSDKLREMIGKVEDPELRDEMLRELDRHDPLVATMPEGVKYTMRATRTYLMDPLGQQTQEVFWVSEGKPDFEGTQSSWPPEELSNIIVLQVTPDPFDALKDRRLHPPPPPKELGERRDYQRHILDPDYQQHILDPNRRGEDDG